MPAPSKTLYITGIPAGDALLQRDGTALLIGMLLDQQVPMVRFAVQLHQLEAHLFGNAQADLVHSVQRGSAQGLPPVFDHKDQGNNWP
jgi:hypothetical protein